MSIREQSATHCQLCCPGAAGDSGHKNDSDPVTTANEAYGVHSLPVSKPLSSAASFLDTETAENS